MKKLSPKDLAAKILGQFYIQVPSDIQRVEDIIGISEVLNAHVKEGYLTNCAARVSVLSDHAIITYDTNTTYRPRIKFSIAHELGHFLLGHKNKEHSVFEDTENDFRKKGRRAGIEKEADEFASELLLPTFLFDRQIDSSEFNEPNFFLVKEIASMFNMSITATAMKLVNSDKYCCALIVSEGGIIQWFRADDSFPYRIISMVHNPLPEFSCANERFNDKENLTPPETLDADIWFEGAPKQAKIVEHSFYMSAWDTCLTLLWPSGDINA